VTHPPAAFAKTRNRRDPASAAVVKKGVTCLKKLTKWQRHLLLTIHIMFSGIMLGCMAVFLILNLAAAATSDPDVFRACYRVMHILADSSVRASTIGAVASGVLLSVLTHWGLVRYYWIIAKELLTLGAIAVNFAGMHIWSLKAAQMTETAGLDALQNPEFTANRLYLFAGIAFQIISLVAMFLLSVSKPWGKRAVRSA
jgi:uncharacterized membrane protein